MRRFIKDHFPSLFLQFALLFVLISIVPFFLYTNLIYKKSSEQISSQSLNYSTEILRQVSTNIDVLVDDLNTLSILPYTYRTSSYNSIQDFLSLMSAKNVQEDSVEGLNEYKTFDELIKYTLNTKKYLKTVIIITKNGDVYYEDKKGDYLISNYQFQPQQWMEDILANTVGLSIIPTHSQEYMSLHQNVLTFARNILDTKVISADMKQNRMGTMLIDINLDVLKDICESGSIKKQGEIIILDNQGKTVYSPQSDELGTVPEWYGSIQGHIESDSGGFTLPNTSNEVIYNYYKNEKTGWTILNIVKKSDLLKGINDLKRFNGLIVVLFLLELPVMLLVFYLTISLPMKNILKVMKGAEHGALDARVNIRSNTELGIIGSGLNTMLDRIKHFINQTYVVEKKQREAELDALKSQIDPHFLYNTLEAIRMSAILANTPDIADMISSLSMQLRYTIGRGKDIVKIRDEIANVRNYFNLIKLRYRDRVNLTIDIDDEIAEFYCLRLILQPLVENAVVHGILPKDENGAVTISASMQDSSIRITVCDDGVGVEEEEELARIQGILANDSSSAAGVDKGSRNNQIGLKNVHDRIRTYFGGSYGISISNAQGMGVCTEIRLPIVKEQDVYVQSDIDR